MELPQQSPVAPPPTEPFVTLPSSASGPGAIFQKIKADPKLSIRVDESTMRAEAPLPRCRGCGTTARPNILMFGDWGWDPQRTLAQEDSYAAWRERLSPEEVVVIELGAGTAIPTVRRLSDQWQAAGATLLRINPREPAVTAHGISLRGRALEILRQLNERHQDLS